MQIILPAIRGIVLIEGVCMVMRGGLSRFTFFENVLRMFFCVLAVTWHINFLIFFVLLSYLCIRSKEMGESQEKSRGEGRVAVGASHQHFRKKCFSGILVLLSPA